MGKGGTIAKVHTGLLTVERIQRELAAATRVDEVKRIKDQVEAIRMYLRKQGAERQIQNDAAEAALYTTRRLGELLEEQKRTEQRATRESNLKRGPKGQRASSEKPPPPTLKQLGIEPTEARRAVEVAKVPEPKFKAYIEETKKAGAEVTHAGLRREVVSQVRRQERVEKIADETHEAEPIEGVEPCGLVYVDPPWSYDNTASAGAVAEQYDTMSLADIKALKVPATPTAILFMWATSPLLPEAFEVLAAWGFRYRASMVWDKGSGTGNWVLNAHELLLIATRGDVPCPLPADRPVSVVRAPKGRHSAKPEEFAALIERMYPEFSKVELFARSQRAGWRAWGNQAP